MCAPGACSCDFAAPIHNHSNTFENSSNYLAVSKVQTLTLSSIHVLCTHQQSSRGCSQTNSAPLKVWKGNAANLLDR